MGAGASTRLAYGTRRALACVLAGALLVPWAAPSARAEAGDRARAERLTDEAYAAQAEGKHAEAIGMYLQAYELSNAGAILYNIAAIYDRKLHERGLAIDFYRRYLQAPDATPEFVEKANARLAALKREADEEEAKAAAAQPPPPAPAPASAPVAVAEPSVTPPAAETAPPPPSGPSSEWRTAGIVVGLVGVAGLGTSVALGLAARSKNDEASTLCGPSTCATPQGVSADHDAAHFATASTIAFVAGAALVGTGVALYFFAPRSARSSSSGTVRVAPQAGVRSAGLTVVGSF